jgi:hypothetical protein
MKPFDVLGVLLVSGLMLSVFGWAAANMRNRSVLVLLLVLGLAIPANAGNCHLIYRQQVVVAPYVQQVVAYAAPVHYAVGQAIQDDAIAEKIASKVVEKLRAHAPGATATAPGAGTLNIKATLLASKCARCHSGDAPKAGITLDGSKSVDDGTFRAVVRMLGTGKGVPKAMAGVVAGLTPADKGGLTEELLGLEAVTGAPPEPGDLK